ERRPDRVVRAPRRRAARRARGEPRDRGRRAGRVGHGDRLVRVRRLARSPPRRHTGRPRGAWRGPGRDRGAPFGRWWRRGRARRLRAAHAPVRRPDRDRGGHARRRGRGLVLIAPRPPPVRYARTVSYGQFCSIARALDLVGERWTLLVVRELL